MWRKTGVVGDEESRLIIRAQKGEQDAFCLLVTNYQRKVYRLAYRMVGNHHDADEVAQKTFIRLCRSLKNIHPGKPVYPWLYRVTVNYALKLLKQKKPFAFRPEIEERIASGAAAPDKKAENREISRAIESAIKFLPPKQRAVFVLFEIEGLSLKETAAACRVPEGTIKWRLFTAKKRLRRLLKDFV